MGDFNGDGKLDLVIADTTTLTTYILAGNGNGNFQAPAIAAPEAGVLAVADLTGNGKLDLVVDTTIFAAAKWEVNIFLGKGDGGFTPGNSYFNSQVSEFVTPPFSSILIADFNGDHKLDLAAQGTMLLGYGDGTFAGSPFVPAGTSALGVLGQGGVTGDFNGDGRQDVAVFSQDTIYVLLGDGTGKLAVANTYILPTVIQSVATADLRNDGRLDLVIITNDTSNNWILNVMLGGGDGSFAPPATYPQGVPGAAIALADFNGDRLPDLAAISNGELQVFLGKGDGTFAAPVSHFAGTGPGSLVTSDFNNDGKVDVAVAAQSGLAILLGNGDGTFQPAMLSTINPSLDTLFTTGDFNGDGNTDIIVEPLQILLGKGDGTFTVQPIYTMKVNAGFEFYVAAADLNGDGKLDLLVLNSEGFLQDVVWFALAACGASLGT
jgi:hypothetical protein